MRASPESLIVLALLLGGGLWLGARATGRAGPERLAWVLLPLLLGGLAVAYWETTALNTRWTWSACRLAPTIGLFHGQPLYSPEHSGAINGWLYGPVAALVWTPAALAGSPLAALTIAALLNQIFLLTPLLVAAQRLAPTRVAGGVAFVFGAAALLQVYPTWYMASALNVDAIAVGLGAGSCLLLLTDQPPSRRRLGLAAALSVLAVWTKQTEAPLVLAQAGWLWLRHGQASARSYLLAYGAALLATAGVFILFFPLPDLIFNLWTVPSAHARPGGWQAAWAEVTDLGRYSVLFWLPCAAALWIRFRDRTTVGTDTNRWHPLWLPLAAATVLLPTGILAAIKIGGDRNSLHSVYYLALAAVCAVAQGWPTVAHRRALAQAVVILLLATGTALLAVRQVAGYPHLTMLPARCLSEEAWSHARTQPDRVYYPWDPLASLMAESRAYHFEYGVIDRILAGRPPNETHIRAHLPGQLDQVVYPNADHQQTMRLRYLTEYRFATATADWLIFRQNPPTRVAQP
ncbi:hypothetical protein ESB00_17235 [Oleiharenicola lentus]|uniref:Glycosyltransferase RgtA/B/C/D-like domain-containing protein n=1 Tax=Oleiharenicola lentus TaxID=2508720 RepID=A0A4Q1C4T1_9BACT|nr:hypothetical protein [Oleiharenicola lentus]RXK53438.1 hypothetical protein ESB00_17235 [Oleiharenicola lentus]